MSLYSGYNANFDYGNGYTPAANAAIANNNANYIANQNYIRDYAQSVTNQQNADWARTNPASGYGQVGGYPSFGDPAPVGTYSPGGGLSSYSGTPVSGGGGGGYAPQSDGGPAGTEGMSGGNDWWVEAMRNAGASYTPQTTSGTDFRYSDPGYAAPTFGSTWNIGGGGYQDPSGYNPMGDYSPGATSSGLFNPADAGSLTAPQQSYLQQHIDRYGYAPPADYFSGGGYDRDYGGGGGGDSFNSRFPSVQQSGGVSTLPAQQLPQGIYDGTFAPTTPRRLDTQGVEDQLDRSIGQDPTGLGLDQSSLTPAQQSYVQQHIDRYGYAPEASYFSGGGWDRDYGGGSRNSIASTIMAQGDDPALAKGDRLPLYDDTLPKGDRLPLYGSGGDYALTPQQQNYDQQHLDRYGYRPNNSFYAPGGGWDTTYGDLAGSQPAGTGGYAGAMGGTDLYSLTPQQQSYVQQHIDRYGYAPEQGFFNPGGGWDQNYGEGAPQSPQTTSGTDLRYSNAGYDPPSFASVYGPYFNNSGQQGVTDPMGYNITEPGAIQGTGGPSGVPFQGQQNFNELMGQRFNGTGLSPSVSYNQQDIQQGIDEAQRLKDLYEELMFGSGRYDPMTRPTGYRETLQPGDVFTSPGGGG